MDRETCHKQLLDLLLKTSEQAQVLRKQLADEAAALAGNNADLLESMVAEKNESVRLLEQLEKQRQKLFDEAGFASNRYGADACIKWCDQDGAVTQAWGQLLDEMEVCRHQNRVNGTAVEISRHNVQHLLDLLRGQLQTGRLYDPTGETATCSDSTRTLAKA